MQCPHGLMKTQTLLSPAQVSGAKTGSGSMAYLMWEDMALPAAPHRRGKAMGGLEHGATLMPAGILLIGVGDLQNRSLCKRPPDELQADRQPVLRKPAGHG